MIDRRTTSGCLLSSCVLLSCTHSAASPWQGVDPATWQAVRQAYEEQRGARPSRPWAAGVRMSMREPRQGRVIDGRGAIAVAPGRALRMILVGAAGATLLDAWMTPDKWRISVPPAALLRQGDVEAPADLPVGFLRWLFFRPLEGTLFAGSGQSGRMLFMLRDNDAVIEVHLGACDRGELVTMTRRSHGRTERLEECRASRVPRPDDWVRYEDQGNGFQVALTIESVAEAPPDADAFRDPALEAAP
jgi:hypothetical protein